MAVAGDGDIRRGRERDFDRERHVEAEVGRRGCRNLERNKSQ